MVVEVTAVGLLDQLVVPVRFQAALIGAIPISNT